MGFAAETERLEEYARQKLEGKRLDMIVANQVGAKLGFDEDDNSVLILWRDGQESLGRMAKCDLARRIIATVAARHAAAGRTNVTPASAEPRLMSRRSSSVSSTRASARTSRCRTTPRPALPAWTCGPAWTRH